MFTYKLPIVFVMAQVLLVGLVQAEQIPAQKPDGVEGKCNESGGVFFPKTGRNSTYGCINGDGSGIVCGGIIAKDKRTCDTFMQTPHVYRPAGNRNGGQGQGSYKGQIAMRC